MWKKFVTVTLILFLLPFYVSTSSLGEMNMGSSAQPLYTHILKFNGSIDIINGKAVCYGSGRSQYADTTTIVKVTLQKRATGTTTWSTVCSWSATQSGTAYAIVNEEKSVSQGYDYRIWVKCTITDSEGVIKETDSMYSRLVSY